MILSLLLGFIGFACQRPDYVWTSSHSFRNAEWRKTDTLHFEPDTLSLNGKRPGRGVIILRYGADASVETLPVVVMKNDGKGKRDCDTLTIRLLPFAERTANNGNLGVFEKCDTFALVPPPEPGWRIDMLPAIAEDSIAGMISLTLILE